MKSSSLTVLYSACTTNWAYRAICHDNWSAHCVAFLPRDDMLARYMLSSRVRLSVRPSVRLSVTSRYCIETVRRTELVYGTGPKLCYKEIRISPKNKGTSLWNVAPNSGFRKFRHDKSVNKTRRRSSLWITPTMVERVVDGCTKLRWSTVTL